MNKNKKSGKAMYALRRYLISNTSLRHTHSNLRNKRIGLEGHECVESFEQYYYSGKNESEL